jgi:hypothetical protein
MSSIATLPPNLRQKIAFLARRIRLLRALRGGSLLVVVLLSTASSALVMDYWLGLPTPMRLAFLIAWVVLGSSLAIRALCIPLCRKLGPDGLAALVEARHPELGERLTTAVELAANPCTYHGSASLVALLIDEAEARAIHLNFLEAAPVRPVLRLAGGMVALLLLLGSCVLLWPRDSLQLGRRFLLPWRTPGAWTLYSLEVRPGNFTAAKGRPLTLCVTLVPEHENVVLPSSSTLVVSDGDGNVSRLPMLAERPDAFSLVLDRVNGDFRYHIEAGEAISDTYQVTAFEPVELAADSPTITIDPPPYAKDSIEKQIVNGWADLTALQHSRIRLDFRFTQPARTASLEWPSQKEATVPVDSPVTQGDQAPSEPRAGHPLVLTADHCGASCDLPALIGGSYRLLLEEEHGIRTELEPRILTVQIDQPPTFVKVAIGDQLQTGERRHAKQTKEHRGSPSDDTKLALPGDSVPLEVALADDVGVVRAEVEYRLNDGSSQCQPIVLDGAGSREARGLALFKLSDKGLEEGDTLRYRIRTSDNRRVPEAGLEPQTVYYPLEQSWLTLKITSQARPFREQEILSQRDDIDRRLAEIHDKLMDEQRSLKQMRPDEQRPVRNDEAARELKQVREQNRTIQEDLHELANLAADIRPLRPLAGQARDIADEEMSRSGQALQRAEQETQPEPRNRQLGDSDKELTAARSRIEQLRQANERLAQARLELLQLELLSERQQRLAERTAGDSTNQPSKRDSAPQLKREQKDIANNLQRLADQSEPIRKALDAARTEQAQKLAARARELAQGEKELLEAVRETRQREKEIRLAELADKQRALAEQASQFAQETRSAAYAALTPPLRPDDAKRAVQALQEDDLGEALRLQHRSSDELERLAKELDQATEHAREPAEATRQLARLQEALRQKVKEHEEKKLNNPAGAEFLDEVRREQEALARAAEILPTPSGDEAVQKEQRDGVERAMQARDALEDHDARHAEVRMAQAAQALEKLAQQLPRANPPQTLKKEQGTPPATARGQAPEPAVAPQGLPSHEQAKQAREMAQQQRELTEAVQDLMSQETQGRQTPRENPISNLAREQAELARQTLEMARDLGRQRGQQEPAARQAQQAAESAEQTSKQLRAGAIKRAYQTGTQTARELQELAQRLNQVPREATKAPQQASQLGERQEDLNRRMMELVANPDAQQTQQQARQQELQEQTSDLSKQLKQLAQAMVGSPVARLSAQRAADSGRQAQAAMEQVTANERQGNQRRAQQAQQQAAGALNQAAKQVEMAAQQMAAALDLPQTDPAKSERPGQAIQNAQTEMSQAQMQLGRGEQQTARAAMARASQALKQAAHQLQRAGQPNQNGQSYGQGVTEAGRPDSSLLGSDAKAYAGKRWGELPGELRTKIIQDMRARYGEDYARIIQLYFEQIADTRKDHGSP